MLVGAAREGAHVWRYVTVAAHPAASANEAPPWRGNKPAKTVNNTANE